MRIKPAHENKLGVCEEIHTDINNEVPGRT